LKKTISIAIIFIFIVSFCGVIFAKEKTGTEKEPISFTQQEKEWLEQHKDEKFLLGLLAFAGMDYFENRGELQGYMFEFVELLNNETGLDFEIFAGESWSETYNRLHAKKIDVLFGANATEERKKTMVFTEPVHKYPYALLAVKGSEIRTIGDVDSRKIGFIKDDMVINAFGESYKNISYYPKLYSDQVIAIEAMLRGEIDGFITSGTEVVNEYLYKYDNLDNIAEIKNVYSDQTLSGLKENKILIQILNKVILSREAEINSLIEVAMQNYLYKALELSDKELQWIEKNKTIKAGVPTDYLPIDHYFEGNYTGVAGEFLSDFCKRIGIKIECVPMTFDVLYEKMNKGEIDLLNMAKTKDREKLFAFTRPFSNERDVIYGMQEKPIVSDIYGLEGTRVAVIDGFWHEEYLNKNLNDFTIIHTKDIKETLALIKKGKADYFIENPTVAEYYIQGLGYTQIVKKGNTSADSFLYFGCQKEDEEFVSIFNKTLKLMDYEKAKYEGVKNAPALKNIQNIRLTKVIIFILISLIVLAITLINIFRKLIIQKETTKRLKEREHLIYTDALTGLYNRMYFNSLERKMSEYSFPQAFIMMDLNKLKKTNDTFGHSAGDMLIQEFAKVIQEVVPHERIMRMGGDEFFVFIEEHDTIKTQEIVNTIKQKCMETKLINDGEIILDKLGVSIGYYVRETNNTSTEEALNNADKAMYENKLKARANR